MAVEVNIKDLFNAGVHFGHKTSHWNPKMAQYIHSKRQDSHIIDLEKTVDSLEKTLPVISKVAASGKQVLFVGTKKHVRDLVRSAAESVNQPYVTERWMGGILTNSDTIGRQVRKLKDLEKRMETGDLEKRYSKLEVQRFREEIEALNSKYSGIKNMPSKPGILVIVDAIVDANAIREANKLNIPVVSIVDTNANPTFVDYVIPGNDDAIKSVKLILDYICEAVKEGAQQTNKVTEVKEGDKAKLDKQPTKEAK